MQKAYKNTIEYYNNFGKEYATRTTTTKELEDHYNAVLPLLKNGAKILDFGCGTGRDSAHFSKLGFDVVALDASPVMCEIARNNGVEKVVNNNFFDLQAQEEFDLVWANCSLLHVRTQDMPKVFGLVYDSLKPDGKFFMSFKYGKSLEIWDGRLYNNFTQEKLNKVLEKSDKFTTYKIWISDEVRVKQSRVIKQWLNAILIKNK